MPIAAPTPAKIRLMALLVLVGEVCCGQLFLLLSALIDQECIVP